MKKLLLSLITLILLSSLVIAQGQDNQMQDSELGSQTETQQQNQGEETQLQTQTRLGEGNYITEEGKELQIQEQAENRLQLKVGDVSAQTSMEMTQEQTQEKTKLMAKLSNGNNVEIKVMPDTASEKALERLRLRVCSSDNGCQIELKEVGQGVQLRAAYEVKVQKESKVLGLFKAKMQVKAQVDAESGELIQAKKPWWAFLASESE